MFYSIFKSVFAFARTAAHQCHSAVFHHCDDILEIDIDEARLLDDFDNASDSRGENLVRLRPGLLEKHGPEA